MKQFDRVRVLTAVLAGLFALGPSGSGASARVEVEANALTATAAAAAYETSQTITPASESGGTVAAREPVAPAPVLHQLARSYQRLERAIANRDLDPAARRIANRSMDDATTAFFRRQLRGAAMAIDASVLELLGIGDDASAARLFAHRPLDATGFDGDGADHLTLAGPGGPAAAAEVVILPHRRNRRAGTPAASATNDAVARGHVRLAPAASEAHGAIRVSLDSTVPDGRWRVMVRSAPAANEAAPAGPWLDLGTWTVQAEDFDTARRRLEAALADVPQEPETDTARRMIERRLRAVRTRPAPNDISGFALDRPRLVAQLSDEIAGLAAGRDPFVGAAGDRWLGLPVAGTTLNCRIIVPADVARAPAAPGPQAGDALDDAVPDPPLIVAFHGAGGNEHLFVDGQAAGRLVSLAADAGAIVVSPPTTAFTVGQSLQALVDAVAARWAIDRQRVLIIGHSMGGMTGGAIAGLEPDTVTGVVCVAGAPNLRGVRRSPPMRFYGAGTDVVVPAAGIRRSARIAAAAGLPVTYHEVADAGHLIIVPDVLDEAVAWLLALPPLGESDGAAKDTDEMPSD